MKEWIGSFLILFFGLNTFGLETTDIEQKPLWKLTPSEFFSSPVSQQPIDLNRPDEYVLSISIFHATNQLRFRYHLISLSPQRDLHDAGKYHLNQMIEHRFFGHNNPLNPDMRTVKQRIENYGGNYFGVGENIAMLGPFKLPGNRYRYRIKNNRYQYFDMNGRPIQVMTYGEFGQKVVEEWFNSPGHRANLLNKNYRFIGIATRITPADLARGVVPDVYAIQEFGI